MLKAISGTDERLAPQIMLDDSADRRKALRVLND
jgi:hypothetical protein